MNKNLWIYLAGSIRKGRSDNRQSSMFWEEADEEKLVHSMPHIDIRLLHPGKVRIDRADSLNNFGSDITLLSASDVVLADLRARRGIGVGAEMMYASLNGIPVICICPTEGHYRRALVEDLAGEDVHNWTRPFVAGLATVVVEELDGAVRFLRANLDNLLGKSTLSAPHLAIRHFLFESSGLRKCVSAILAREYMKPQGHFTCIGQRSGRLEDISTEGLWTIYTYRVACRN